MKRNKVDLREMITRWVRGRQVLDVVVRHWVADGARFDGSVLHELRKDVEFSQTRKYLKIRDHTTTEYRKGMMDMYEVMREVYGE
jgi:hypothetical protein